MLVDVRIAAVLSILLALVGTSSCTPPEIARDAGQLLQPGSDGGRSSDGGSFDGGEPPTADAGAVDGGAPLDAGAIDAGEDAGAPDAGPIAETGEACIFQGSPRCADGLTCLRPSALTNEGVCRVDCAERDEDGNVVGEAPTLCDGATTCQTVTTPTLQVLGLVCLPPVETRDEPCPAPEDEDACAGDLVCAISASEIVLGVLFVDEARCKLVCDAAEETADAGCPLSETCLGPRSPVGTGVCGRAVPLWDGSPIPEPAQQCNESTGHDYCDDRPLRGLEAPAKLECVTGFYLDPALGLCMGQCSQPAFDYNGDGEIVDGEAALDLQCAAGFVCDQQRARDFGLIEPVRPPLLCDDFGCFPGEPCPACGPGAECVLDFDSGDSICAAVYGFCVSDGTSDAGPSDAG